MNGEITTPDGVKLSDGTILSFSDYRNAKRAFEYLQHPVTADMRYLMDISDVVYGWNEMGVNWWRIKSIVAFIRHKLGANSNLEERLRNYICAGSYHPTKWVDVPKDQLPKSLADTPQELWEALPGWMFQPWTNNDGAGKVHLHVIYSNLVYHRDDVENAGNVAFDTTVDWDDFVSWAK